VTILSDITINKNGGYVLMRTERHNAHSRLKTLFAALTAASLILTMAMLLSNVTTKAAQTSSGRPLVGVIRYDAFTQPDSGDTIREMRYLGPKQYESQLPFYAVKPTDDTVIFNNATQEVVDQEILYAYDAGIDYWAMVYASPYSQYHSMSKIYQLHLSSKYKNLVKFCFIIYPGYQSDQDIESMIDIMCNPVYQKTPDGKVLLYTFISNKTDDKDKIELQKIKQGLWQAKRLELCIITLNWTVSQAIADADRWAEFGAVGCSTYIGHGEHDRTASYATMAANDKALWDEYTDDGRLQCVPQVCTGIDSYSRYQPNGLPWEWDTAIQEEYAAGGRRSRIYPMATKTQLQNHLRDAFQWIKDHPENAKLNSVLMYSWNEFSEGGQMTICPKFDPKNPTLGFSPDNIKNYDRTVLDWIKEVLTEEPASRTWPEKGNKITNTYDVSLGKEAVFNGGTKANTPSPTSIEDQPEPSEETTSIEESTSVTEDVTTTTSSSQSKPSGGDDADTKNETGMSPWAITLIAGGAAAVIGIAAALVFLLKAKGKRGV